MLPATQPALFIADAEDVSAMKRVLLAIKEWGGG
jgi:hypothetical protein